jgi:membrane-associated phospholipid phosphatase
MLARQKIIVLLLLFAFPRAVAQNVDVSILRSVFNDQTTFKNNFFRADAETVVLVNLAAPISIFTAGLIKHDPEMQRDGLFISGAITQSLKFLVKRERPFIRYPQYFSDRYDGGGYSFPSGHTSSAFCTATSLSLYFPKWYVIVLGYLWAASVGWARMYQGVHYPSDVFVGALVGAGSAWSGKKVQEFFDKKHLNKRNTAFAF